MHSIYKVIIKQEYGNENTRNPINPIHNNFLTPKLRYLIVSEFQRFRLIKNHS
jgi:hypothetical protein